MTERNRTMVLSGSKLSSRFLLVFCIACTVTLFSGCSGGGDGVSENEEPVLFNGQFIDSAAAGLVYETPTVSGITDDQGTFSYAEGETVTFRLGSTILGRCPGKPIVTPIDLVPGAVDDSDPTVTNLCRFIQALDEDRQPENGITITAATRDLLAAYNIDFSLTLSEFPVNEEVNTFFDDLAETTGTILFWSSAVEELMPPSWTARRHLRASLKELGMLAAVSPEGIYISPDGPVDDDPGDGISPATGRYDVSVSQDTLDQLIAANNEFAFQLLAAGELETNLVLSPYGISTLMGMLLAGADGETKSEIKTATGLDLESPMLHQAFNVLGSSLTAQPDAPALPFSLVLGGWAQTGYTVFADFYNQLAGNYGVQLEPKNLMGYRYPIQIENWIAVDKSYYFSPFELMFEDRTRIVLAAAAAFEGNWETPFPEDQTKYRTFERLGGSLIDVSTMHTAGTFAYTDQEHYKAISLPFEGNRFNLILILPEKNQFESVSIELVDSGLQPILDQLSPEMIDVYLPKFYVNPFYSSPLGENDPIKSQILKSIASTLGMETIWQEETADFSRIHPTDALFVKQAPLSGRVAVTETGTEVSTINAVEIQGLREIPPFDSGTSGSGGDSGSYIQFGSFSGDDDAYVSVVFSRPFLFALHDSETNLILHAGRIVDPNK